MNYIVTLNKITVSLVVNIVGNTWDDAKIQLIIIKQRLSRFVIPKL